MKNQNLISVRFRSLRLLVAALFACVFVVPSNVTAQEPAKYLKDSIDASLVIPEAGTVPKDQYESTKRLVNNELTSLESDSKKVLKGDLVFGPNRAALDKYFNGYFLPRMTHHDDINLSIGKERDRLLREFLPKAINDSARDHLLDNLLFPFAQKVCEGNYHPAARINAMYIIASLNRREGVKKPTERVPVLMPQALNYMIQTIDAADKPPFLKAAALMGIDRHVGIDQMAGLKQINDTTRTGLLDRMMKLVQQPYTGKKSEDDLLYYEQRIATHILGNLHNPGAANAVALQLSSMIANEKLRLWLRHDAIQAFGKLQFPANPVSQALIMETIDKAVKFVSNTARKQADTIQADIIKMKEDVLVFTGKDLAKIGVKKDAGETIQNVSMGTGGDFEVGEGEITNKDQKPKVELPNYRLNLYRRELKILTNSIVIAIYGTDAKIKGGLATNLSDKDADKVKEITIKLRKMLRDVDVAMFGEEFDNRKPKDVVIEEALTERLRKTLIQSANDIDQIASITKTKPADGKSKDGKTAAKVSPLDGGK